MGHEWAVKREFAWAWRWVPQTADSSAERRVSWMVESTASPKVVSWACLKVARLVSYWVVKMVV